MHFDWEDNERYQLARSNFMACAYNAAVNFGTERGRRKMGDLIDAINHYERVKGHVKLRLLVQKGVIDGFTSCPPSCEVRPGGLFHAPGCENDLNHPVYRRRQDRAEELLPGRSSWLAASVSLVA